MMNQNFLTCSRANGNAPASRSIPSLIAVVGMLALVSTARAQQTWPEVPLPKDVKRFAISAGTVEINGMPTHIQGFQSPQKPEQVLDWFRNQWGTPVAENRVGTKQILGREQAEHYTTVQLEPAGKGTRGMVSITSLKQAQENMAREQAVRERWQARLPAGSRLVSRIASEDGGKQASHLTIVNAHSEELNRKRIVSLMQEDGLQLERDRTDKESPAADSGGMQKNTLFFKGRGKEAIAVIFRDRSGQSAIVLNTITAIESFK